MDFRGPETADYANVKSLNQAFLLRLRNTSTGRHIRQQMPAPIQEVIRGLTDLHISRLAAAPFLLMSLREGDAGYWQALGSGETNLDLLEPGAGDVELGQLGVAGVAFLWQLARRDPYAARLVSGATLAWCEQLANDTLLGLLQRTASRRDLLQARLAGNADFWNKLLGSGLSSEADVRLAAQMAALQTVLTDHPAARYRPLRAAACSSVAPSLQVAGKRQR